MLESKNSKELKVINFENSIEKTTLTSATPITIYCDGACSGNQFKDNIGGWGAIMQFGKHEKEIYGGEKNTTNNRMELVACIKALEAIKTTKHKIKIYSDSAYVVDNINNEYYKKWEKNGWRNSQKAPIKNKDLWDKLLSLVKKYDCDFIKVKGHSGYLLNERADALAQRGIDEIKDTNNYMYDSLAM